jgi:hypothetical protein
VRVGIHYDTGFFPAGRSSREVFDPEQVAFDINAVAHDLRCHAIRVSGGDLARLAVAAEFAAAAGLCASSARPARSCSPSTRRLSRA